MPSSSHCRRIDNRPCWRSMSSRRSGALIFRTSWLKSRSTISWPILATFDLALAVDPGITIAVFEGSHRLFQT
jgi:hypothetical protein